MSFKAGTEENGALVAPGLGAVKHNSYRHRVNFAYIDPATNTPTKSGR
jgi:hypothetical protein